MSRRLNDPGDVISLLMSLGARICGIVIGGGALVSSPCPSPNQSIKKLSAGNHAAPHIF